MEQKQIAVQGAVKILFSIVEGPHKGMELDFTDNEIYIGRSNENQISLNKDLKVSRNHAKVYWQNGSYYIQNLRTNNPLQINGKLVELEELPTSSIIEIGESKINIEYQKPNSAYNSLALIQADQNSEKTAVFNPNSISNKPVQLPKNSLDSLSAKSFLEKKPMGSLANQNLQKNKSAVANPINPISKSLKSKTNTNFERPNINIQKSSGGGFNLVPFLIGAVAIIGLYFFFSGEEVKKSEVKKLRSEKQITEELKTTETIIEEHKKNLNLDENNQLPPNLQRAQEYYLKGFRDYRQGQYTRAIQSFQAALSFDSSNLLAKKYLAESRRKNEEFIQVLMLRGRRYRDKGHFRLCAASYKQAVEFLSNNKTSSNYIEAEKNLNACETLMQGRY